MTLALSENFVVLDQVNRLRAAMLGLSKSGYVVRRFSGGSQRPSIEIDRPLAGVEPSVLPRGDRTFFSVDYQQCRVFWVVEKPVYQGEGSA